MISDKVPVLADFKPSGKYLMEDLHQHGGVPAVMKYLLSKGLLHGDCLTVTGKTVAENLKDAPELDFDKQKIIMPLETPIKATGICKYYMAILLKEEVLQRSAVKKENILKDLQGCLMANMI